MPAVTRPVFGAEPRELSLLFVLFYIAASGNESNPGTFERNFNTKDGAQMYRFKGGAARIAELVAKQLGNRVRLASPVRRHHARHRQACRSWPTGSTVNAKRVIVAVPPTLAGRLDYEPALPAARDQLTQRLGQGTLTKVTAVYDTPFWRAKGLTGTSVSADGLVNATFDDSPESGAPGVLFGFVGGDSARAYERMDAAAGRAAVLEELATLFGPEARSSARLPRHPLDERALDARLPGGDRRAGHAAGLRRRRSVPPAAASTSPAPRPRPTGTATWTVPCDRANAPPPRCWTPFAASVYAASRNAALCAKRPEWKAANVAAASALMPVTCATCRPASPLSSGPSTGSVRS